MASKSIVRAFCALCITAILAIAVCGCDDLGEYEDVEEYYGSFGNIILVSASSGDYDDFSVEDHFYNKESRENFMEDEDSAYERVDYSDYVYVAIPFKSNIDMDSIALFMQSQKEVAVYINIYVVTSEEWEIILSGEDNSGQTGGTEGSEGTETGDGSTGTGGTTGTETGDGSTGTGGTTDESEPKEPVYNVPESIKSVGDVVVQLKAGRWGSFVLDSFVIDNKTQKSIQINSGEYVLLQIRNNCGVLELDEKQNLVDPQIGIALDEAKITMTNLLIRALDVNNAGNTQGGE